MAQQVKFDENVRVTETTRTSGGGGGGGRGGNGGPPQRGPPQKEDFAHQVGDALTKGSGPGGYLAVGGTNHAERMDDADMHVTVVPREASQRPPSHQDDYVWITRGGARVPSIVDRERPQQTWTLLYEPCAEDGSLRCLCQRAIRTFDDQDSSEAVQR